MLINFSVSPETTFNIYADINMTIDKSVTFFVSLTTADMR